MLTNVDRIFYFLQNYHFDSAANHFRFEQFDNDHAFHTAGVNWYIWLTAQDREVLKKEYATDPVKNALRNWHIRFLLDYVDWLQNSNQLEKWIVFAMEPREVALQTSPFNPNRLTDYDYVKGNKVWLTSIAKRLKEHQDLAQAFGKTLQIVIRFASEMNDVGSQGNTWALDGSGTKFKDCFKFVHDIFKNVSPDFKFCFSPALRSDINTPSKYPRIGKAYPGDNYVDIVSGTWYVPFGPANAKDKALSILRRYYEDFAAGAGKPIALDEMGIFDTANMDKDPLFQEMFQTLASLSDIGSLTYVTLFFGSTTSLNAPLNFLRDPNYVP